MSRIYAGAVGGHARAQVAGVTHRIELRGVVVAAVLICVASAAWCGTAGAVVTNFTWSGGAPAGTPDWSSTSNWVGGSAPSGAAGTLVFPALGAGCSGASVTQTCYASNNDLTGVSADQVQLDDASSYTFTGNGFTLGSGGLTASPQTADTTTVHNAFFDLPITLGATQTWSLTGTTVGNTTYEQINEISIGDGSTGLIGSPSALTVNMTDGVGLSLNGDTELGPVTVQGPAGGDPGANGTLSIYGSVNTTTLEPLTVDHVYLNGRGAVGPLASATALVSVGPSLPPSVFHVASATFDGFSEVVFWIEGTGTTAGTNYSQLTSTGDVALGGARLLIGEGDGCPDLPIGNSYTLVSTTGAVNGTFAGLPDGATTPDFGCAHQNTFRIHYGAHAVTATVVAGGLTVTLSPSHATNPLGTNHSVTAHVADAGTAVSGVPVHFAVTGGPNKGASGDSKTNGSGNAGFTYAGIGGAGTDTIRATVTPPLGLPPVSDTATKTWTAASLPPQKGETVSAKPTGSVSVRCPGERKRPLGQAKVGFPLGCELDATHGSVQLNWSSGCNGVARGVFGGIPLVVGQAKDPHPECPHGLLLDLQSHAPKPKCGHHGLSAARLPIVHFHALSHHRHVRSRHHHSAAIVHGTEWDVVERCSGTFTRAIKGTVTVRDYTRHKTVKVNAGHSYLARVPSGAR
jgi:hypothetical protein